MDLCSLIITHCSFTIPRCNTANTLVYSAQAGNSRKPEALRLEHLGGCLGWHGKEHRLGTALGVTWACQGQGQPLPQTGQLAGGWGTLEFKCQSRSELNGCSVWLNILPHLRLFKSECLGRLVDYYLRVLLNNILFSYCGVEIGPSQRKVCVVITIKWAA